MKFFKTFLAGLLAFVVGSFVMMFLWIIIIVSMVGSMEQVVKVESNSILKIDLAESIVDSPSANPFDGIDLMSLEQTRNISLFNVLKAIEAAKGDDRIKGIYLNTNGNGFASLAIKEELREALADFKTSGKFVVSYNQTYGQSDYYLASVADKIYMEPNGGMSWQGMSFNLMFYKGLLDKLDIGVEIFRPTMCKYKSAVEPYFLTKMSEDNREQMQMLANSMWSTVTAAVSESRGIKVDSLNMLADNLSVTLPEEALKHRFVDGLIFEDQMNDVFKEFGVEPNKKGDYEFISLGEYVSQVRADLKNISASQIAIVYAEGAIVDGDGYGSEIYGNSMARIIAEVRKDDKVKAVVLRVNSPGGSALASDIIWREIQLLRKEKPVIVSMGSYAASGGYYIACPADAIVADRTTLTGSIGVFGMMLNAEDALKNKLGITFDGVKTNTSADMGQTMRGLTATEKAAIMRSVDKVYDTFTSYVAEGRNLPIGKVLDLAGGRVWSGVDALDIGLIDSYGGLKAAIAIAADKAALGDQYRIVEKIEEPVGFAALFSALNASVRSSALQSELGVMMRQYKKVQETLSQQGIVTYCPYDITFE